eukprot:gene10182-biopygen15483
MVRQKLVERLCTPWSQHIKLRWNGYPARVCERASCSVSPHSVLFLGPLSPLARSTHDTIPKPVNVEKLRDLTVVAAGWGEQVWVPKPPKLAHGWLKWGEGLIFPVMKP